MKSVALHNLGCKVNAYELEVMQQKLQDRGYKIVPFDSDADIYIVNTCTVTNIADRKSRQMLHRAKHKNPDAVVVAVGCFVQAGEENRMDDCIDLAVGNQHKKDIVEILEAYLEEHTADASAVTDIGAVREYEEMRMEQSTEHTRAYIKIQDGCNQFCSYCIIPFVRGRVRSRKQEDVLAEVRGLAEKGFQEVVITGIHLSSYGMDFIGETDGDYLKNGKDLRGTAFERAYLVSLLEEIAKVDGIRRIRFMTSHPKDLSDDLIEVMATSKKVCKHMHLPMQSGSSRLLKLMNRHYTKEQYVALAKKIQERIPGVSFTTDIIVGFPGETEEDFKETLDVVREVGFDSAYTYVYSKRSGTPAASMEDQVDKDVIKDRFDRLLALLKETSAKNCKKKVGDIERVLIEEENTHEEGMLTGRLENNLLVHFKGCKEQIGTMADVKLVEEKGFYYMGEQIHG